MKIYYTDCPSFFSSKMHDKFHYKMLLWKGMNIYRGESFLKKVIWTRNLFENWFKRRNLNNIYRQNRIINLNVTL